MRLRALILVLPILSLMAVGCGYFGPDRIDEEKTVTIFYGAGYNNLSSDIAANVHTMISGQVPAYWSNHKFLIYTHLSRTDHDYVTPQEGHLVEYYTDVFGNTVADTLLVTGSSRTAADPEVLREVLEFTADKYPDSKYGLIVSSHGTGWLPAGVYSNSTRPVQFSRTLYRHNSGNNSIKVKTFVAEALTEDGVTYSREMSVQSMAKAITIPLDYIIFDACLMGGVEVAYEFRGKAAKIGFSPAEVLSTGFNFSDLSMLISDNPDPKAFCQAYYDMYDVQSGARRSATISLIDTEAMSGLATVCNGLFAKYREAMSRLDSSSSIQEYFRENKHWFYDLADVLVKAGISESEKAQLEEALAHCIIYKAATPSFMLGLGGFEINTYCGMSMYLPSMGNSTLDTFYRTLAWNKATNLVE